jgi:hypothetical protein
MKKTLLLTCLAIFSLTVLNAQNNALYFDGLNDKVGILDSPELNPEGQLTIEAWINAESWKSSIWAGVIVSKQATNPDQGYGLTVGENGRIEFNHSIDEAWVAVNTSQILGLNTWYHIAGVYNGTSMKLYVNGILQSSVDVSGDPTLSSGVMNFAENPTWNGRNFNGILDEIRIWETARTQQQIQDNMTTELSGNEDGLVGYWNMNEGTGNTINDASGNENTGTLLNMDESNWVDGFTPPGNDVGVIGIAAPSRIGGGFTSAEKIKVDIKNFATEDVSGFDVSYQINGGEVVTETVDATIPAFDTYIHTFQNAVDLAGVEEIELKGFTGLTDDSNKGNDTLMETISQTNEYYLWDNEQHNYGAFGQTHTNILYMPGDLSGYSEIYLHVDLACPVGGCDPWDQPAKVSILKDALSYEVVRYITPYGKACGGWTWDITDFKPIMMGKTEFQSYVQVWGASGWLVTVQLELIPGTPDYPYLKLTRLWNEDNWVYGDQDIPHDFPERIVPIDQSTEKAKVRMTMTGHGQGNTNNAAEFFNVKHHLWVDGNEEFEQHLWRDDCGENECSPQNGTWTLSRAGWCPGQDVQPWEWDLSEHAEPGEDMNLDFVLQDYVNLLDSGYNGSTHTEPHYRCHTYLVEYSKDVFVSTPEQFSKAIANVTVYPNPTGGELSIKSTGEAKINGVFIYRPDGALVLREIDIEQNLHTVSLAELPVGVYIVRVVTDSGSETVKVMRR